MLNPSALDVTPFVMFVIPEFNFGLLKLLFFFLSISWELLDKVQQIKKPLYSCLLGFDAGLMVQVVPDVSKDRSAFNFRVKLLFLDCMVLKLKARQSFETLETTRPVLQCQIPTKKIEFL